METLIAKPNAFEYGQQPILYHERGAPIGAIFTNLEKFL
jgi:hypothetical protein